jgi:hypothetical protein
MEMLMEERLVLCVLRHANQIAQSVSAVSRLTGLDRPAVEFLLRRLMAMGLCERGSIGEEARYWAVPLSEIPILDDPLERLAVYCSRPIEVDEGDSEAVSYEMSGIVILVAIVTGTREPAVIAELTKLPPDFVGIVIELCHRLDLYWSPWFYDLERTVREQGDDAEKVSAALIDVKEEFWWSWLSPRVEELLHSARANLRYGGARDPWAIAPDPEQLERFLKRLALVKR